MFSNLISVFIGWKEKLIAVALAIAIFSGWLFKVKRDAEFKGAEKLRGQIEKDTKRIEHAWTEIDNDPLSPDDAFKRLRKLSRDQGRVP